MYIYIYIYIAHEHEIGPRRDLLVWQAAGAGHVIRGLPHVELLRRLFRHDPCGVSDDNHLRKRQNGDILIKQYLFPVVATSFTKTR